MLIENYKSLYRAKILGSEKWIEGSLIVLSDDNVYICPMYKWNTLPFAEYTKSEAKQVDEKTICPSFMYRDDDGKTIYDKDIVEFHTEWGRIDRYLIQWNDEGQEFQSLPIMKNGEPCDIYYGSGVFHCMCENEPLDHIRLRLIDAWGDYRQEYGGYIRIIGNIFDNPELMPSQPDFKQSNSKQGQWEF